MKCSTNRCRTNVFEELDRGLNQLMRGTMNRNVVSSEYPRLSLLEFDNRYLVECDVPGVSLENVALQIEDGVLTISGKRKAVSDDQDVRVLFSENPAAEFSRQVQLARDVDQSAIDAELTNGVLRITLPKRAEVLPRKIEIKRTQSIR